MIGIQQDPVTRQLVLHAVPEPMRGRLEPEGTQNRAVCDRAECEDHGTGLELVEFRGQETVAAANFLRQRAILRRDALHGVGDSASREPEPVVCGLGAAAVRPAEREQRLVQKNTRVVTRKRPTTAIRSVHSRCQTDYQQTRLRVAERRDRCAVIPGETAPALREEFGESGTPHAARVESHDASIVHVSDDGLGEAARTDQLCPGHEFLQFLFDRRVVLPVTLRRANGRAQPCQVEGQFLVGNRSGNTLHYEIGGLGQLGQQARMGAGQAALGTGQLLAGGQQALGGVYGQQGAQQLGAQAGYGGFLGGLGQQAQAGQLAGLQALTGIGGLQQQQQQAVLDAQRQAAMQAQAAPLAQYQALQPFISMAPTGQTQISTQFAPAPSPLQAGIGTGLATLGALGQFFGGLTGAQT